MKKEILQLNKTADHNGSEAHISKRETARRLNCGLRTLDEWMKRGLIPYYKIGRHVSFVWSEVQEHLRNNCRINRGGSTH
jgi:excisionase family DNA binding protein